MPLMIHSVLAEYMKSFTIFLRTFVSLAILAVVGAVDCPAMDALEIYVSNEKSGDLTVIDGASQAVTATIPVGKRPRGIRLSPDGKTLFVAVSGTPISAPPQLDAKQVRERLGLSQAEFALRFGLELDTVQNWEQGRYRPDPAARLLLGIIDRDPKLVDSVLAKGTVTDG